MSQWNYRPKFTTLLSLCGDLALLGSPVNRTNCHRKCLPALSTEIKFKVLPATLITHLAQVSTATRLFLLWVLSEDCLRSSYFLSCYRKTHGMFVYYESSRLYGCFPASYFVECQYWGISPFFLGWIVLRGPWLVEQMQQKRTMNSPRSRVELLRVRNRGRILRRKRVSPPRPVSHLPLRRPSSDPLFPSTQLFLPRPIMPFPFGRITAYWIVVWLVSVSCSRRRNSPNP